VKLGAPAIFAAFDNLAEPTHTYVAAGVRIDASRSRSGHGAMDARGRTAPTRDPLEPAATLHHVGVFQSDLIDLIMLLTHNFLLDSFSPSLLANGAETTPPNRGMASKADSLRAQDVRDAYRLIGECRDVGSHPSLWYPRMLAGLSVLFGVKQAAGGEGWWPRRNRPLKPVSAYSVRSEPAADVAFRAVARTREQLVPDAVWYRSVSFEYLRMGELDHALTSVFQVTDDGAISGIALNRAIRDRDFSGRERRLLEFFHAELGRLIGGPLVSATEPGLERLSPRLHQTLVCLLEGDSEKQIAGRLGLSPATVHQYVTALYRRSGVQSRAQLLVHVLKRIPRPQENRRDGGALRSDLQPESPARLTLVRGSASPRRLSTG